MLKWKFFLMLQKVNVHMFAVLWNVKIFSNFFLKNHQTAFVEILNQDKFISMTNNASFLAPVETASFFCKDFRAGQKKIQWKTGQVLKKCKLFMLLIIFKYFKISLLNDTNDYKR